LLPAAWFSCRRVLVDDLHRLLVVVDQRVEDVGVQDQRLVQQRRLQAELERVGLLRAAGVEMPLTSCAMPAFSPCWYDT
jgi:hypothetical protein